jgi:microsomal dipeptidase-like Zn-dependent dipeptidase
VALAAAAACALPVPAASAALGPNARYELVHGCYGLKSVSLGRLVATDSGPFRMQATELGRYLFYGRKRDFLTAASSGAVQAADKPSDAADWRVDVDGDAFKVTLPSAGKSLGVDGAGQLILVAPAAAGQFTFEPAQGCPEFPEVQVNATGTPSGGPVPYSEVAGMLESHMHLMAYEFLGGSVHCGRPWHRWGVEQALVDCPEHYPNGAASVVDPVYSGGDQTTHDPVGWPTFKDWPHHASVVHEQSYYKWLERAWRGGLRIYVNLLVENAVLCEVYPMKKNSCNEMDSVRLQARRMHELQNYIDAQSGGPGKGWFRMVTDPFQARRVINQGKLAVVMGIEVSKLFDCGEYNDVPQCDKAQIDRSLDEVYRMGVRDMELINKFDNALGGVAGDAGTTGVVVNQGNKYATGHYWRFETCPSTGHDATMHPPHDEAQSTVPGTGRDTVAGNVLQAFLPPGTLPLYPDPPHCNTRGLTQLGEHLVRRMIDKRMIVDPDHLGVLARNHLLSILESRNYSGVISSHSWSTSDAFPRIFSLGGLVIPKPNSSTNFVKEWRETKPLRDKRYVFGFGWGADQGGFGTQGGPRTGATNPVRYPFKSFDGAVTLDRQRSGQRLFDINVDGVAHYGLYPDYVEDVRKIAGDEIIKDMARGSEAYLQMWERAEGVPRSYCHTSVNGFGPGGVGKFALRSEPDALLRQTGQPTERIARTWRWCAGVNQANRGQVVAVFTPGQRVGLVAATAPRWRGLGVGKGSLATRLRGRARPVGGGLYTRRLRNGDTMAFVVRRGRVRYVAVASPEAARSAARLRAYLKLTALS